MPGRAILPWHRRGVMMQVEVFTPLAVLTGTADRARVASDASGVPLQLPIEAAHRFPLAGGPSRRQVRVTIEPDEILLVAMAPPAFGVHAQWYPIDLDLGPYHLEARLPTAPGFDPARALARPRGAYVALHDVAISVPTQPGGGVSERPYVEVNRYAVDRIASNLMLGFFFPGATQEALPDSSAPPIVLAV
jgi:hypothetical protein